MTDSAWGVGGKSETDVPAEWLEDMRAAWEREKIRADELERRLREAEAERLEQARLLGISGSTEARLLAELAKANEEGENLHAKLRETEAALATARRDALEESHVGWCRYLMVHEKPTRIVMCDSDEKGAFKVYRALEAK